MWVEGREALVAMIWHVLSTNCFYHTDVKSFLPMSELIGHVIDNRGALLAPPPSINLHLPKSYHPVFFCQNMFVWVGALATWPSGLAIGDNRGGGGGGEREPVFARNCECSRPRLCTHSWSCFEKAALDQKSWLGTCTSRAARPEGMKEAIDKQPGIKLRQSNVKDLFVEGVNWRETCWVVTDLIDTC